MRIDILSLFPEMLEGTFGHSIVKRAQTAGKVEIYVHQLRKFSSDKHKRVDDYPYSGGAGMVMQAEPLVAAIEHFKSLHTYDEVIFLTPDAQVLNQSLANQLSLGGNLLMLCGHYKGIDERVREHYITMEISIGDYVLSGGEIAAMALTDSIVRLLPGVLGDETSALSDSFQDGLLSPPVYTRPLSFRGHQVPDILLSGHERKIAEWKHEKALERTRLRRPDLYKKYMAEE